MFTYYNWLKRLLKKHKVKDKMGQRNLKLNTYIVFFFEYKNWWRCYVLIMYPTIYFVIWWQTGWKVKNTCAMNILNSNYCKISFLTFLRWLMRWVIHILQFITLFKHETCKSFLQLFHRLFEWFWISSVLQNTLKVSLFINRVLYISSTY